MRHREFEFPAARVEAPKYGTHARAINSLTVLAIGVLLAVAGVAVGTVVLTVIGIAVALVAIVFLISLRTEQTDR